MRILEFLPNNDSSVAFKFATIPERWYFKNKVGKRNMNLDVATQILRNRKIRINGKRIKAFPLSRQMIRMVMMAMKNSGHCLQNQGQRHKVNERCLLKQIRNLKKSYARNVSVYRHKYIMRK
jgi:hypothetical protein